MVLMDFQIQMPNELDTIEKAANTAQREKIFNAKASALERTANDLVNNGLPISDDNVRLLLLYAACYREMARKSQPNYV